MLCFVDRLNVLADGCTAAEISNVRMMFSTGEIAENADGFSKLGPRVVGNPPYAPLNEIHASRLTMQFL